MKFIKTLPYKLKRILPIFGIAGASLLAGCNKDDEPTPPGLHDTVYTWTMDDMLHIPIADVCMSADSANVNRVILRYVGGPAWLKVSTLKNFLQNTIISEVTLQNQYKIRGDGEIPEMVMEAYTDADLVKSKEDSVWLTNFGFKLTKPIYRYLDRTVYGSKQR